MHDPAMQDHHVPRAEFVQYLEWQTLSELRRAARFESGPPAMESPRRLERTRRWTRAAALVIVSTLAGASAVTAADYVQASREQEVRIEQNKLELNLASRRVSDVEEACRRMELRVEEGAAPSSAADALRGRLDASKFARDILQLTGEELKSSGRAVNERLTAPLAAGRDFVAERLALGGLHAKSQLKRLESAANAANASFKMGAIPAAELAEAKLAVALSRSELEHIDHRAGLRVRFLAGEVEEVECERQDRIASASFRVKDLDLQLEHHRALLAGAVAREEAGFSSGESDPIRSRIDELGVERAVLRYELELLGGSAK